MKECVSHQQSSVSVTSSTVPGYASCRQAHQHTKVSSPLDGSASPDPSPPPPPPRVRRKQHQHQCTTQRGAERMKRNSLAVELTNHHACHLPSQIQDRKLPKRSLYEKRPRKSSPIDRLKNPTPIRSSDAVRAKYSAAPWSVPHASTAPRPRAHAANPDPARLRCLRMASQAKVQPLRSSPSHSHHPRSSPPPRPLRIYTRTRAHPHTMAACFLLLKRDR